MGLSFSKDKNIDIYANLDRQYYVAGETVSGQIYLNAKATRPYSKLIVRISGEEHVYWHEGHGNQHYYYWRTEKNYQGTFQVRDFQGRLDQGQYTFPFSFLLPNMITGSFYNSSSEYLKYILSVELESFDKGDTQKYEMFLNIIEPPRFPLSPVSLINHVNSKCCHCCCDYGITSVTLASDKNFVFNGDKIQIKGRVDNTAGTEDIKQCTVMLEERLFMTDGSKQQDEVQNEYMLGIVDSQIRKGATKDFNFNATIPIEIVNYTAIGRIIARYFVIHLYTEYGCCANKAEAVIHVVVHSRTPKIRLQAGTQQCNRQQYATVYLHTCTTRNPQSHS